MQRRPDGDHHRASRAQTRCCQTRKLKSCQPHRMMTARSMVAGKFLWVAAQTCGGVYGHALMLDGVTAHNRCQWIKNMGKASRASPEVVGSILEQEAWLLSEEERAKEEATTTGNSEGGSEPAAAGAPERVLRTRIGRLCARTGQTRKARAPKIRKKIYKKICQYFC